MGAFAKKLPATLDDFCAIPEEDRRHELTSGVIIEKEAASGKHGGSQADLVTALSSRFGRRPGGPQPGGWWFATEVEILLAPDRVFRPDILAWRRERAPERPSETPVTLLPDWVCEILSTNRGHELIKKKRIYHQHKVPHYWVLDSMERTLSVHRWAADGYIEVLAAEREERVRAEPFDACELFVGSFFGEDDPEG